MKILQLAKTPDATETYRLVYPQRALEVAGHEVRRMYLEAWPMKGQHHPVRPQDVEWADLLHVQRPLSEFSLKTIQQVKARYPHLPIVGDYDDDYFHVPRWNQGYTYVAAHSEWWPHIVPLFDGITFSTHPLRESFEENGWTGPSAVIQNVIDLDAIEALEPRYDFHVDCPRLNDNGGLEVAARLDAAGFNELARGKTVVCWAGSAFHYADIDQVAEALKAVAEADENVLFIFVGYTQGNIVKALPSNRLFLVAGSSIEDYYRRLKSLKIDISLAPLHPCKFNNAKSNLKLMEAFSLGWFPVAVDLDPYFDDLDPEAVTAEGDLWIPRHGLLVDPNFPVKAWSDAILKAIAQVRNPDVDLWRKNNLTYVRERYTLPDRVEDYDTFFRQVAAAKARESAA